MKDDKIYNDVKDMFLFYYNNSIQIKKDNSIFFYYNKNLNYKLKNLTLKGKKFNINNYININNINWKNEKVIFEQNIKNKIFWFDYHNFWQKIELIFSFNYKQINNLLLNLLNEIPIYKNYTIDIFGSIDFKILNNIQINNIK